MRRSQPQIAYIRGTILCTRVVPRQDYSPLRSSRIGNTTAPLTARYGTRPDEPRNRGDSGTSVLRLLAATATPQAPFPTFPSDRIRKSTEFVTTPAQHQNLRQAVHTTKRPVGASDKLAANPPFGISEYKIATNIESTGCCVPLCRNCISTSGSASTVSTPYFGTVETRTPMRVIPPARQSGTSYALPPLNASNTPTPIVAHPFGHSTEKSTPRVTSVRTCPASTERVHPFYRVRVP